jgi:hypothetical protein
MLALTYSAWAGAATSPRSFQPVREARLRPEAAHRYPWIRPGEWQSAATLADRVLAGHLLRGADQVIWGRVLRDGDFEFRGGSKQPGERAVIRP